jgi:hypothetical protein
MSAFKESRSGLSVIPTEVEKSLTISEISRDLSTPLEMTTGNDEYAKALKGKRHFKDEAV